MKTRNEERPNVKSAKFWEQMTGHSFTEHETEEMESDIYRLFGLLAEWNECAEFKKLTMNSEGTND